MATKTYQEWDTTLYFLNQRESKYTAWLVITAIIMVIAVLGGLLNWLVWWILGPLAGISVIAALVCGWMVTKLGREREFAEMERDKAMSIWVPADEQKKDWNKRRAPEPSLAEKERDKKQKRDADRVKERRSNLRSQGGE